MLLLIFYQYFINIFSIFYQYFINILSIFYQYFSNNYCFVTTPNFSATISVLDCFGATLRILNLP